MTKNWGDYFYDHYDRFLGQPIERAVFRQDDQSPSIQILTYDNVFEGCRTFCSLGLSHYAPEVGKVAEIVASLDDGWQDFPKLVANALYFLIQNRMQIGWGLAVGGVQRLDPDFAARFGKTALYFSQPFDFPPEFAAVNGMDAAGHIYMASLISPQEYEYFCQRGAEAFEALMAQSQVDPYHLQRPSCA